jgi:hypothetical protein
MASSAAPPRAICAHVLAVASAVGSAAAGSVSPAVVLGGRLRGADGALAARCFGLSEADALGAAGAS